MDRHDLYGSSHKGIRAHLFDAAARMARADFALAGEAAQAAEALEALLADLAGHAESEDRVIMPELQRLAPELHDALAADHARTEGLQRQLAEGAARLRGAGPAERVSLGRRLLDQANALVAEHLRHMAVEEGPAQRVLWAHHDDAGLRALHQRIVARHTPAEVAAYLARTLPALNRTERAAVLGQLRAAVPPAAFDDLTAPARRALGPELWAAALAA